ncbi:sushi domain-containing protein 1 isoform X10 [Esox lucius]|uniref:sushi domain-containing protein 1 isoform X10 n=1 Tax=Esox lucius TaxID=8010 RepID=UPI001476E1C5|nr:sushi domain-containing protein 1 isoform X10 [Esox lucius]
MVGRVAEVNQASPAGRGCEVGFHRGLIEGDPLSHSGRGDSSVVDLSLPSTPHQAKFIPKDQLETQQWMAILRLTPFNNLSPLVCDAGHQVKIAIVMVSETHWIFLQETLHRVCRTETTLIGQTLDVCATCHPNATCEEKVDGTGKVCNCMYGFLGNGRTYCQDKDECQMGTSKICGKNTACHNTYGSYYCTCLTGYSPSNSMAIFIPNDGTHCQDIDECRIQGICGEGGQCTNIPGNFHCHCQVGYRVQNGAEPFHPHQDQAVCKAIDCGQPPLAENAVRLSATGTRYGSIAKFACAEGFLRNSGDNFAICGTEGVWKGPSLLCEEVDCGSPPALPHSVMFWDQRTNMGSEVFYQCNFGYKNVGEGNVSHCNADGQWDKSALLCEAILCGDPPILPHTGQVWNGSTNPGSTVLYYCKEGFYRAGGGNISYCTEYGYWTNVTLSCKEVDCGSPPALPHSVMFWDQRTNMGSEVFYQCNFGYKNVGEGNVSHCMADGAWDQITFLCEEIDCGEPLFIPNTKMIWNRTSLIGSVVYYQCVEGYYNTSGINYTECGENGLWTDIKLQCEEVNCGPPLTLPHANMQWTNRTGLGSVIEYICKQGFYQAGGNSLSTCTPSGQWGIVSIICKAKCGPVPALANSEVVWQNVSAVMHRCVEGFHSWRGRNTSLCDIHGKWQSATIRCREIKPPISDLVFLNEKCLRWKADKYEADAENYQVEIVGFRAYQRSFHDKRKKLLRSISDHPEICLNLLPVTNYTFSITALSARFTSTLTAKTSLREPQAPEIVYSEVEAPLPTLWLRRFPNTLDPISFYQVFVCPLDGFLLFDCSSTRNPDFSIQRKSHGLYITAQVHLIDVWKKMNLTVGDGRYYGGFYNAPLQNGRDYYIILRAVSHWGGASKHCCFIWAKVSGTSYLMKVSSLYAAGSIGVVALAMCLGYCYTWFFKKT